MLPQLLTAKIDTLYVAYAPDEGVFSYGHCLDEAVNGLSEEIQARGPVNGKEGRINAII